MPSGNRPERVRGAPGRRPGAVQAPSGVWSGSRPEIFFLGQRNSEGMFDETGGKTGLASGGPKIAGA